jgi:hypothetical protein
MESYVTLTEFIEMVRLMSLCLQAATSIERPVGVIARFGVTTEVTRQCRRKFLGPVPVQADCPVNQRHRK